MAESFTVARLTGFGRGKNVSFEKSEISLGTDPGCDVRFDPTWDKTVSPHHALITKRDAAWWLIDQSRDGSFIEGRRITEEKLSAGATIELGLGGPRIKIDYQAAPAVSAKPHLPTAQAAAGVARSHQTDDLMTASHGGSQKAGVSLPVASTAAPSRPQSRSRLIIAGGVLALGAVAALAWILLKPDNGTTTASREKATVSKFGSVTTIKEPALGANIDWQPIVDMGEEIFPSFIIASATMKESPFDTVNQAPTRLGDRRGIVGVRVSAPKAQSKIRVEIGENEIMRASSFEAELPAAGETYTVYPTPTYRFDALAKIKQTIPLAITLTVSVDGMALGQKSKTVRVESVNVCPFAVATGSDLNAPDAVVMHWMFAAYVNENHPISDELRKEALKTGIVKGFAGYQGDAQAVYQQVFAIWYALQRRGVRYSNITTTPGSSKAVFSQYVRFIDQSLNNSQANCVDGSVLFASVLRQIGIEPILVLVPGHMFVGFYVDPQGQQAEFLETTMIGQMPTAATPATVEKSSDGTKSLVIRGMLEPAADTGAANKDSMEAFVAAVKAAREQVGKHFGEDASVSKKSFFKERTVRKQKANCQMLPVARAREMGVMPIGYQP